MVGYTNELLYIQLLSHTTIYLMASVITLNISPHVFLTGGGLDKVIPKATGGFQLKL